MCVSTGKAGVLKAWTITTAAVFRPVASRRAVSCDVMSRAVMSIGPSAIRSCCSFKKVECLE